METDRIIDQLAQAARPVRPLRPPLARTMIWLLIVAPFVAMTVFAMSPRTDLAAKASDPHFVIEMFAALATGVAAALAAFATTIPGRSRKIAWLPLLPLGAWLGSLGHGCLQSWIRFGADGLTLRPDWVCFPAIALVGAVPALAMAVMLRRGAPLAPHLSTALGGLAAAGLGNVGLRLFHAQDASLMVLVWQVGSVFVLAALAGLLGRSLLHWRPVPGTSAAA